MNLFTSNRLVIEGRCQTSRAGGKMFNFIATGRIAEHKTKYLVTTGKLSNHSLAELDMTVTGCGGYNGEPFI